MPFASSSATGALLSLCLASLVHPTTSSSCPPHFNFGSCPNPGIEYGYGLEGSSSYGYAPAAPAEFPHAFSPDIANVESYICARLHNRCNADSDAVRACFSAFWRYSGLSGQNAADAWNGALGVGGGTGTGTGVSVSCTETTTTATITETVELSSILASSPSLVTVTSTDIVTSTQVNSPTAYSSSTIPSTSTTQTETQTETVTLTTTSSPTPTTSTSSVATVTTSTTTSTTTTADQTTSANPAINTDGSPFPNSAPSRHLNRLMFSVFLSILTTAVTCLPR